MASKTSRLRPLNEQTKDFTKHEGMQNSYPDYGSEKDCAEGSVASLVSDISYQLNSMLQHLDNIDDLLLGGKPRPGGEAKERDDGIIAELKACLECATKIDNHLVAVCEHLGRDMPHCEEE